MIIKYKKLINEAKKSKPLDIYVSKEWSLHLALEPSGHRELLIKNCARLNYTSGGIKYFLDLSNDKLLKLSPKQGYVYSEDGGKTFITYYDLQYTKFQRFKNTLKRFFRDFIDSIPSPWS